MKRWATAIWQCFGIWLLLAATITPHLHSCGPHRFGEQPREEKEEKNRPCEEDREKEAIVHAVRRHCRGHHERHSLEASAPLLALHHRAAAWQGQLCLADAMRGERGFYNGCGATLLR